MSVEADIAETRADLADAIVQRIIEARDYGHHIPGDLLRMLEEWERNDPEDPSLGRCGAYPNCTECGGY